jgi:hypothetical protein
MSASTTTDDGSLIDLSDIDAVFDQIEKDEKRSMLSIMMYLHNLGMIAVIGFSGYVFSRMQGLGNKQRYD